MDIINPMDMRGRAVLVTGASSGIGRDTAVFLSELGATVLLVGRNLDRLDQTLRMMSGEGHRTYVCDVSKAEDLPSWLAGVCGEAGKIDSLVHCAGISITQAVRYLDWDDANEMIGVNLKSAVGLAKAFRQKGCRSPGVGKLVMVSSVSALRGYPGLSVYSATKAGLIGLARTLAAELAREGIRVNCVTPGLVATEMVAGFREKLGSMQAEGAHVLGIGTPRDVSSMIGFLLADTGNWITGQSFVVDGGVTL